MGEKWIEDYLAEHPEKREMRCRHRGCAGPLACACCASMMVDIDPPEDTMTDDQLPPAPPLSAEPNCVDCGSVVVLCEHAAQRLMDPERGFWQAEVAGLQAVLAASAERERVLVEALEQAVGFFTLDPMAYRRKWGLEWEDKTHIQIGEVLRAALSAATQQQPIGERGRRMHCCYIPCAESAECELLDGPAPDDYTHACTQHVGPLLQDNVTTVYPLVASDYGAVS